MKTRNPSFTKRIICVFLSVMILFSFMACGKNSTDEDNYSVQTTEEPKVQNTISEDLVIRGVYIKNDNAFGQHAFVFVKNCSEDTVIDYNVIYLGFDLNGNPTRLTNTYGDQIYGESKNTLANILPGAVYGLKDGSTEGIKVCDDGTVRYVQAAVSYIKFKSGETWELADKDAWADETTASFSVEAQKEYIASLKADAEAAMENPYLSVIEPKIHGNSNKMLTQAQALSFSFKNIGEKTIRSFNAIILEYDAAGKGIELTNQSWRWNYQYITSNSRLLKVDANGTEPQREDSVSCDLFLVNECASCLIIVETIEFDDDTVWYNDCALQFMAFNESEKAL